MSIIIHGPQGCGKTINAAALMRAFACTHVVEADEIFGGAYGTLATAAALAQFKAGTTLYLTSEPPPHHLDDARRVISFDVAIKRVPARKRVAVRPPCGRLYGAAAMKPGAAS